MTISKLSQADLFEPVATDERLEPEQAAMRQLLGVRPTEYVGGEPHPDQRSCPTWCYVGQGDYEHEIEARHPMAAEHTYNPRTQTVASLYSAIVRSGGLERVTEAAHIGGHLSQRGQGQPVIRLVMHDADDQGKHRYRPLVRLTVEDARELISALDHLANVATGGEEPLPLVS